MKSDDDSLREVLEEPIRAEAALRMVANRGGGNRHEKRARLARMRKILKGKL